MERSSLVHLLVICIYLVTPSGCENKEKCDDTVIQCIKDANGGTYPISLWTSLQVLWNRDYSIVWYSGNLVKKDNLQCITTVFGVFGTKDTYYHTCSDTEVINFKSSLNFIDKTFQISNYRGLNMKAYVIYFKRYCLGLYVCSPDGVTGSHITLYCPTKKLEEAEAEIEEAKAKFTSCNINDGVALCTEKCT